MHHIQSMKTGEDNYMYKYGDIVEYNSIEHGKGYAKVIEAVDNRAFVIPLHNEGETRIAVSVLTLDIKECKKVDKAEKEIEYR